jgi:hypothetical protein
MKHYDYEWDLYPNYLKLDGELPTDSLGWQEGDLFRLETCPVTGVKLLKKVSPIEKFTRGYSNE